MDAKTYLSFTMLSNVPGEHPSDVLMVRLASHLRGELPPSHEGIKGKLDLPLREYRDYVRPAVELLGEDPGELPYSVDEDNNIVPDSITVDGPIVCCGVTIHELRGRHLRMANDMNALTANLCPDMDTSVLDVAKYTAIRKLVNFLVADALSDEDTPDLQLPFPQD